MFLGNNLRKLGWDVAMNIHIMNYGSYVLYTTCTVVQIATILSCLLYTRSKSA